MVATLLQRPRSLPGQTGWKTSSKRVRYLNRMNLLIQTTLETSRDQTMKTLVKMMKLIRPILDQTKVLKEQEQEQHLATLVGSETHLAAGGD